MKRVLIALLACVALSGCVTTKHHAKENRKELSHKELRELHYATSGHKRDIAASEYGMQKYTSLCTACNKTFRFSQADIDRSANAPCPYCGHSQDLMAGQNAWDKEAG
jgi:hypothetical protein